MLLRIENSDGVVYSSFESEPDAQLSPAMGATVWRARQVAGHGKMLLVQSALSQELAGYQVLMAFPFQSFFDLWFADLRSIAAISFGISLALAVALCYCCGCCGSRWHSLAMPHDGCGQAKPRCALPVPEKMKSGS
ncbi:hypothetical protein SDC9_185201 [bioreactor metagenome]|uniref:Uncharacterized protein n=1 Tax=bioreactor metagenome TaxID=1076179 RepID=A0A645HF96_9ZZZZ